MEVWRPFCCDRLADTRVGDRDGVCSRSGGTGLRRVAQETGNGTRDPGVNRQILYLAVPNVIASLSDPLVGVVDTALVGHLPKVALAHC